IIGIVLFRKEAMGDGDVKLARAIGAMLPLQQALVSFFFATFIGMVCGLCLMLIKSNKAKDNSSTENEAASEPESDDEEGITLADWMQWLFQRFMYLTFLDLFLQFGRFAKIAPLAALANKYDPPESLEDEEDDFVPGPTHIPFGPYMVLGAFLAVFI